jgi:hypothetical protein
VEWSENTNRLAHIHTIGKDILLEKNNPTLALANSIAASGSSLFSLSQRRNTNTWGPLSALRVVILGYPFLKPAGAGARPLR